MFGVFVWIALLADVLASLWADVFIDTSKGEDNGEGRKA
jgi:hypothetical protein